MIISYHNQNGPSRFVQCDICQREGFDADTQSFDRVKQHLKARGWWTFPKIPLERGQKPKWLHACPACAKDNADRIRVAREALRNRSEDQGEAA